MEDRGQVGGESAAERQRRWQVEAEFFDREVYDEGPIAPLTVQRYVRLAKPWLPAENAFHVLGPLEGKRVLEFGCGSGGNAILLALRGAAHVTGVDVSPRAIEIARRRAEMHGVSDRIEFVCEPLEEFVQRRAGAAHFDLICGWAVLHHVLPALDATFAGMRRLSEPGVTRYMFTEPAAVWQWMRRLRRLIPVSGQFTPGERPLNAEDMGVIYRHFPDLQSRYFGLLARILRLLFPGPYETMPGWKIALTDAAARIDDILLNTLRMKGLGSQVILSSPPGGGPRANS